MPRHVVSSLVLAVVLLANMPGSVAACTCGGTSEDSALANADVAFIGVVTQVEDPNSLARFTYSTGDPILYSFAVEEPRKGDMGDYVTVRSYRDEAACGVVMAPGERWSIYAHRQDLFGNSRHGELWVWLCDGNERLATGVPTLPAAGSPGSFLLLGAAAALLLVITLVMGGTRERPVGPVA